MKQMKFILIVFLMLLTFLLAANNDFNARGQTLCGAVSVLAEDGNAVMGNPALLGLQDKIKINLTSTIAGIKMENDSVSSFLAHGVMPLKNIGTLGMNGHVLLNMYSTDQATGLLYSEWGLNIGFGKALSSAFQFGGTLSLSGSTINENFLPADNKDYDRAPDFNLNLGVNYVINPSLNIVLTGGNLLELYTGNIGASSDFAFVRVGAGFHKSIFHIGAAADYVMHEEKVSMSVAADLFLLKEKLRISGGVELENAQGGFTPNIGAGILLGKISADYNFAYPLSGTFDFGMHVLTLGFIF